MLATFFPLIIIENFWLRTTRINAENERMNPLSDNSN